jgi:hypothetical protein
VRHVLALKTLGLHSENAHCAAALYVPLPDSPRTDPGPGLQWPAQGRRTPPPNPRQDAPLCFQHVNAAATQGYSRRNREPPIFLLVACFQHVYARKPVNAPFFALDGCRCLIPQAFPHGYRAVSLQQPFGGDVSPFCRRFSGVARQRVRHRCRRWPQTLASRPGGRLAIGCTTPAYCGFGGSLTWPAS